MCVTIQVQTATSHQPFHPGLCVSLSRGRLSPVINHSTLVYVCHYPGADCHQSSTIPPWPMCGTIQGADCHQSSTIPPWPGYVCHYPGADCHQSSTIPPWPMCVTIQGQTVTSHQPFHPGHLDTGQLDTRTTRHPIGIILYRIKGRIKSRQNFAFLSEMSLFYIFIQTYVVLFVICHIIWRCLVVLLCHFHGCLIVRCLNARCLVARCPVVLDSIPTEYQQNICMYLILVIFYIFVSKKMWDDVIMKYWLHLF